MKESYYVVLKDSSMGGMKDTSSFNSKTDFNNWYKRFKNTKTIIAQGVSAEKAVRLSDCIDNNSRFAKQVIANSLP